MSNQIHKVVIFGGSGFLGLNLASKLLGENYQVHIISRTEPKIKGEWSSSQWDAQSLGSWVQQLEGADTIINLVGRSVDCIKTPANCDAILRSRVESTELIGKALRILKAPPKLWIQMSTAHIYGDPEKIVCTENSPMGYGLAPTVGQAWEKAYADSVLPQMRQVILRTSFVLGSSGGALPRLSKLVKWGLGGKVSHGQQGISWLHEEDMNRILLSAIKNESMKGIYIATAPEPVSNAKFMKSLRKTLVMPIGLPAPACVVKLAAPLIMKTDPELALYGRYCIPQRLIDENFEFKFPDLDLALKDIYT
ncbi:TIGR01777 family oxidoreductase [Lentisphaera profundi]|uniref:TIGR01777 family oxidoreductase n=1 Tax=Lentisphaera profundi TaxID=1658616 RepID=A0ABY7VWD2_9BACT|nr:TIGR01777 family oxidoreductase [Lentisphaera profundi]WDE96373.1 TIGR01777 family oxidoreductase [Lentisphaera profundi]